MRAARMGPAQIHVQARSNPVHYPDWTWTGQTGLAHSNPARAPAGLAIWDLTLNLELSSYLSVIRDLTGIATGFDRGPAGPAQTARTARMGYAWANVDQICPLLPIQIPGKFAAHTVG